MGFHRSLNTNTVAVSESTTSTTALEVTVASALNDNEFEITAPAGEKFKYSSLSNTNFMLDGKTIPTNSNVRFKDNNYTSILVTLPDRISDFTGRAMLKITRLRISI